MEKKKGIDIFETVDVEESDEETKSDDSRDSDYDSLDDLFRSFSDNNNDNILTSDDVDSDMEKSKEPLGKSQKGRKLCLQRKERGFYWRN